MTATATKTTMPAMQAQIQPVLPEYDEMLYDHGWNGEKAPVLAMTPAMVKDALKDAMKDVMAETGRADGPERLKFVDLFAGLGGFHQALERLGHECVFASEISEPLRKLYKQNFGMPAHGDITKIEPRDIPDHDILCGGFPCQAFSRAGKRKGKKDPRGKLIDTVIDILRAKRPKYLLLENVPALISNDDGRMFKGIKRDLARIGYHIKYHLLSPHQFGIPQKRNRLFIVAERDVQVVDMNFDWNRLPTVPEGACVSFRQFLTGFNISKGNPKFHTLSGNKQDAVMMWQDLIDRVKASGAEWPNFPIWAMEFGANYSYDDGATPAALDYDFDQVPGKYGAFGARLNKARTQAGNMQHLPPYARDIRFAPWKKEYLRRNRQFYKDNKSVIDAWLAANPDFKSLSPSLQKLEWQVSRFSDSGSMQITDYVLQFRQSGVRVKRTDLAPTLTTVDTDVYLGWKGRYMTEREAMKLQSMDAKKVSVPAGRAGIKACGNAVNVDVVAHVARELLGVDPDVSHLARFERRSSFLTEEKE